MTTTDLLAAGAGPTGYTSRRRLYRGAA